MIERKLMKRRTIIFYGLLSIVTLIGIVIVLFSYYYRSSNNSSRTVTVTYRFSIENKTNKPIHNLSQYFYSPQKEHAYHRCVNIESNYPQKVTLDKAGNSKITFHWDVLPPYSSKIVSIKNTLNISEYPRREDVGDLKVFLQPEPFIESDDKKIIALSRRLQKGSDLDTTKSIFDWVSENVVYSGYGKQCRGALYALNYSKGDCTEFANLFVALCRAAGIPARTVGGFACPQNMVVQLSDYHNWAEFYHNRRWYLADPQEKIFMRNEKYYAVFKIIHSTSDQRAFSLFGPIDKGIKIFFKE
jgi:transglutaminase/protease-like cytokinesis protein 3